MLFYRIKQRTKNRGEKKIFGIAIYSIIEDKNYDHVLWKCTKKDIFYTRKEEEDIVSIVLEIV